ncbi:MAG: transglutaminaseTgpA domain-containing protein [Micrococcales bacterium]|nr:transglutaminaseTgpA domain-containing protein [Micrococcales bacterium]
MSDEQTTPRPGQGEPAAEATTTGRAAKVRAPGSAPTRMRLSGAQQTSQQHGGLVPFRADWIDLLFASALTGIALVGFRTGFFGPMWMVAAVSGLVLGLAITHLTTAYRLPAVATMLALAAAYFLLGGPLAVRNHLIGVLPSGRTLTDLASTLVHGWKRWLTMLPPVDAVGPLVALPFVTGLVGAALTYGIARRTTSPYAVLVAPISLIGASIALGTQQPAARLLQGVLAGLLVVLWMVVRAMRNRPPLQNGAGRTTRLVTAVVLLLVAGLVGALVGPLLAGEGQARAVARNVVKPPFDIAQFSSPLAGYRKYTEPNPAKLYDTPLLQVEGLPDGAPLRFATLDSYDGSVWGASTRANAGQGLQGAAFQQVGARIAARTDGAQKTVKITVPEGGYSDVWLPTPGAVSGVSFSGPRAEQLAERVWLNTGTDTAIVPGRLQPGDSVTMTAAIPTAPDETLPKQLALAGGTLVGQDRTGFLDTKRDAWSGRSADAWQQVVSVARYFTSQGTYTDGGTKNSFEKVYLPGHSIGRLGRFAGSTQLAGNDEQYAATLALAANSIGVPTRVVLGAFPEGGIVKGKDVRAWVEVRTAAGEWYPIAPRHLVPDRNKKPNQQLLKSEEQRVGALVPPPAGANPPSVLQGPDQAQNATNIKKPPKRNPFDPAGWPLWLKILVFGVLLPLLVLYAIYWLIRGLKEWRRRRHLRRGPPAARISYAWRETMAHARTLGLAVPERATRLEQAAVLRQQTGARQEKRRAEITDALARAETVAAERARTKAQRQGDKAAQAKAAGVSLDPGPSVAEAEQSARERARARMGELPEVLDLAPLATRANAEVFGPAAPSEESAAAYAEAISGPRRELRKGVGRWARVKSDLNLRPLFATAPSTAPRDGQRRRRLARRTQPA